MKVYVAIKSGWFDTGQEYDLWEDKQQMIFLSKDKAIKYCESITNDELINYVGGHLEPWYVTREHRWTEEEVKRYNSDHTGRSYVYGKELDMGDDLEQPGWTGGALLIVIEKEVIE